MWTSFALALRILTSVPAASIGVPDRLALKRAVILFPFVGAIIGAVCGAAWTLGARFWPGQPLVAAGFVMLAELALTGGRGLGGVGRGVDALQSFQEDGDRAKALAVQRDPRRNGGGVGAIAVLAIVKTALLTSLRPDNAWTALIVVGCVGQWAAACGFSAFRSLPSWNNGDSDTDPRGAGMNEFLAASVLAIVGAAVMPVQGLIALTVVAIVTFWIARSIEHAFSGLNVYFSYALALVGEIVGLAALTIRP